MEMITILDQFLLFRTFLLNIKYNYIEHVKTMLEANKQFITQRDEVFNMSALQMACIYNRTDIAKFLLEKGASFEDGLTRCDNVAHILTPMSTADINTLIEVKMKERLIDYIKSDKLDAIINFKYPSMLAQVNLVETAINGFALNIMAWLVETKQTTWNPEQHVVC